MTVRRGIRRDTGEKDSLGRPKYNWDNELEKALFLKQEEIKNFTEDFLYEDTNNSILTININKIKNYYAAQLENCLDGLDDSNYDVKVKAHGRKLELDNNLLVIGKMSTWLENQDEFTPDELPSEEAFNAYYDDNYNNNNYCSLQSGVYLNYSPAEINSLTNDEKDSFRTLINDEIYNNGDTYSTVKEDYPEAWLEYEQKNDYEQLTNISMTLNDRFHNDTDNDTREALYNCIDNAIYTGLADNDHTDSDNQRAIKNNFKKVYRNFDKDLQLDLWNEITKGL